MGFRNKVPATWVKLHAGKFYIPNPNGSVTYTNKNGITGNYDVVDVVDCYLKSIRFQEAKDGSKYGSQWVFEFVTDDNVPFVLAPGAQSYLPYSLMNSFASITKFGLLELSTTAKIINGHTMTNLYIKNDGAEVKWRWGIDEVPQPVTIMVDGEPLIENGKIKRSFKKVISHYLEIVLPMINEVLSKSLTGSTSDDVEFVVPDLPSAEENYSQIPQKQTLKQVPNKNSNDMFPGGYDEDIPF